jgi:putative membrane protein
MVLAAQGFVGLVALLHFYFLILEMFLWATPYGMKTFKRTKEEQEQTKILAANQGLYNGFLVAGLVWSFFTPSFAYELRLFFLICVIVAGVYGAATAAKQILFVQAVPAAIALALVILSR